MEFLREKICKENLIGYGTSRIVFDLGDGTVAKIPYNNIGIDANRIEYEYYLKNKDIIAEISKYENNIIIQEKLHSFIIVPFEHTINKTIKEYLKNNYPEKDFRDLPERSLFSRMQIGFNNEEKAKFFDYEDSKIKSKYILPPFIMKDEWLKVFFDYYKNNDVLKIEKHETFEDRRGFLIDYEC